MICLSCNKTKPETAHFCQNCGNPLSSNKTPFIKRHKGCLIAAIVVSIFLLVVFFLFFGFLLFIASIGSKLNTKETVVLEGSGENKIAVVNIDGIILEKEPSRGLPSLTEEFTSSRRIKKTLNEISQDGKVKALILRINSPGGSAVAAEEIYQELLNFKKQTGIKIVAYLADLAASGGYYVAVAADSIVANPQTVTGSIGVMISYLNFADLIEKYGVKNIVYKSGAYKDIISEFRQPSETEKEIMQDLVAQAHNVFIQVVSQGRKLAIDKVRQLADGRIYSAQQAKELGLVDDLGSFADTVSVTKKIAGLSQATVVEFGQPTFWELFIGNLLGKFNISLLPGLSQYFNFKPGLRILYLYTP